MLVEDPTGCLLYLLVLGLLEVEEGIRQLKLGLQILLESEQTVVLALPVKPLKSDLDAPEDTPDQLLGVLELHNALPQHILHAALQHLAEGHQGGALRSLQVYLRDGDFGLQVIRVVQKGQLFEEVQVRQGAQAPLEDYQNDL